MTHLDPADPAIPSRAPSPIAVDDTALPFEVSALDVRGRIVRLGPAIDDILDKHDYPAPVAKLTAEAVVLATMLGSALKFDGRFIMQTQTDGPVRMLVVDYMTEGHVRACARFDQAAVARAIETGDDKPGALLGQGHLAMTIDQGADMNRYQGLVPLNGGSLEDAAHEYFLRSEQIPTRVKLAVAEEFRAGEGGARRRWRAGGVMLQFLPRSQERARQDLDPGDVPDGVNLQPATEDDAWIEARALVDTVEDIELIDPDISSERLAYRLFNERGVRVFDTLPVAAKCSCSRDAVETMLKNFGQDDRDHMVEDGRIKVTCEFCSTEYAFQPEDVGAVVP
jgi:molecular chaperone Hsp33